MEYKYISETQYFSRLKLFTVLELAVFCTGATEGCFLLHWDAGCGPLHMHTACMNIFALSPKMAVSSEPVAFSADLHTFGNMGL